MLVFSISVFGQVYSFKNIPTEILDNLDKMGVDKNAKTLYSSIDAMSKEATKRLNIGANINASYGFNRKSKVSANKDMSNNLTGIRTFFQTTETTIQQQETTGFFNANFANLTNLNHWKLVKSV